MAGICANKRPQVGDASEILCKGFKLAKKVTPETIKSSTFAGLLEELLKSGYHQHINDEELDAEGQRIYGDGWRLVVDNWKNPHYVEQELT